MTSLLNNAQGVILTKYAKNPLFVLTYDIRSSLIRKQVMI
jgi:hypothetical protein